MAMGIKTVAGVVDAVRELGAEVCGRVWALQVVFWCCGCVDGGREM
jgi:hypothetical protein